MPHRSENLALRSEILSPDASVIRRGRVVEEAAAEPGDTIFVPEESPMRAGPHAEMRVYHRVDGTWVLSNNRIQVPEGWYLVPPSYVKE